VRRRRLGRLLSLAQAPSPRLARISSELGIPAVEIPAEASLCFVAGIRRPRVLVSSGAVARLSDADLRAALLHERAHLRRSDGLKAAAVSLAAECGIRPPARALRLYRLGREAAADAEAARVVGGDALAELLVRFARSSASVPAAVQLAEREHLAVRVRLLLEGTQEAPPEEATARSRAAWRIATALALGAYPFVAREMAHWIGRCG
jgi:Zn-dependent protease with chaperone function